jgi:hypothetical protein
MANRNPFTKKWHLLPVPVRLGIGLAVVLLVALALGAALPWMAAQAGPTLAGNADAVKVAQATGACCVDGTCVVEGVTEDDCEHNYFGTYQGDGTSCVGAGAKCDGSAIGACCLEDGTCEHRTEESCTTAGGEYKGDGADCATADCEPPPTGGCCLPDETCEVRTEASCDSSRGIYLGDDTDCVEVDCDRGACCLADGSCQDLTSDACYDVAGEYYGDDSDCSSTDCPPPTGACCLPGESPSRYLTDLPDYADCEQMTEDDCLEADGSYQGDGTDCEKISCETGACCMDDGSCQEVTETLCTTRGGEYQGDDTACDPNPCPQPDTGACCLADDSCQILTAVACATSDGIYLGDDTVCDPNPCPPEPTGACCLADGSCLQATQAACTTEGGTYQGDDTGCDPNPCPQPPKGACCLNTGACVEVVEALCVEGTYLGDGTDCDPNPCPEPTGACCLGPSGGYACNELTASECYGNNPNNDHYFQGAGTTCASVNCMPISVIKTADPVAVKEPGGDVTFTVLVINQGTSCSVFIDSLIDDKHGNLDGQGNCVASAANPQEIPAGGFYTCQFTATVNGAMGYVETNTVTASGEDSYELDDECLGAYGDEENQPISAQDSATVKVVAGHDYGDAQHPINNKYPTLLANKGASHGLGSNVYLGGCVDGEADGQPTTDADGDDTNVGDPVYGACTGDDDEDGVSFITCLRIGKRARVNVVANAACTLSAWIDFDLDGAWSGPGEELFPGGQALVAGLNSLTFAVPAEAAAGDTYARFRCTTDGAVGFSGSASDGEVEDYPDEVKIPPPCSADLNCSGSVNAADLSILLSQWREECAGCPEDLNGDGRVNLADLSILASQWGNCP